jgi:hypothetical protein
MGQRLGRMRYALHGTGIDFQLATVIAGSLINVEAVAGFMAGLRGGGGCYCCMRARGEGESRGEGVVPRRQKCNKSAVIRTRQHDLRIEAVKGSIKHHWSPSQLCSRVADKRF